MYGPRVQEDDEGEVIPSPHDDVADKDARTIAVANARTIHFVDIKVSVGKKSFGNANTAHEPSLVSFGVPQRHWWLAIGEAISHLS